MKAEEQILKIVSDYTGVPTEDIMGNLRYKPILEARVLAIVFIRQLIPTMSLTRIGSLFNRDHSTVLHSIANCKVWREVDPEFQLKYQTVASLMPTKNLHPTTELDKSVVAFVRMELQNSDGRTTFSFGAGGNETDLCNLVVNACQYNESVLAALTKGLEQFNHNKIQQK